MLTDIRDAWRSLRAARGTTILALVILTLGIAAGTVTFSVVDTIALRALPFPSAGRLVAIGRSPGSTHAADYFAWRDQMPAFDGMVASSPLTLRFGEDNESVAAAAVTANLFDVLGVHPALGRAFTPDNERPGSDAFVILSYSLWMRRFGGSPSVLGQRQTFSQSSREVIGVMPEGFTFPVGQATSPEAWVPYATTEREQSYTSGALTSAQVVGRLRSGATIEQARSQLDQLTRQIASEFPNGVGVGARVVVTPLRDFVVGPAKSWLLLLLAAVVLVLLVACVNVANLLLARATIRRRELGTREALGASRARLARTLLLEGLMLSLTAAAAGITASFWGVAVAKSLLPMGLARASDIAVDGRVLLVSIAVAAVCGIAFGAAPAWQASRSDLTDAMKDGSGAVIGGRRRVRWVGVFLVAEVAFVVTLLVATGLVVTSFIRVLTEDLGFDRHDVVAFSVSKPPVPSADADGDAAAVAFFADVIERARSVSGVLDAAIMANPPPLSGGSTRSVVTLPNGVKASGDDEFERSDVTHEYLRTMGLRLERGREFEASDRAGAPLVAIIDDAAARRFFMDRDPIGQAIRLSGPMPVTIVGVVHAVRTKGPEIDQRPEVYVPIGQQVEAHGGADGNLVVRFAAATPALVARVGEAIKPALGGARPSQPQYINAWFDKLTADRRFNAGLLGLFGLLAIVMGSIGIYGVMAFLVAQQTRVIGLKMALGASRGRVLGSVLRDAGQYVAVGVALGLIGARATAHLFTSLVFGITTTDVTVYLGVAATLVIVGLLAALIPALRASRVDPLIALRAE